MIEKNYSYQILNKERVFYLLSEYLIPENASNGYGEAMDWYIDNICEGKHKMPRKLLSLLLARLNPSEMKYVIDVKINEMNEAYDVFLEKVEEDNDEDDCLIAKALYLPYPPNKGYTTYETDNPDETLEIIDTALSLAQEELDKETSEDMRKSLIAIIGDLRVKQERWIEFFDKEEYEDDEEEETDVDDFENSDVEGDFEDDEDDSEDSEIEETLLEKIVITSENGNKIIDFGKSVKLELREKDFRSLEKFLKSGKPEKIKLKAKLKWKMLSLSVKIVSNMVYFRFLTFSYKMPLSSILPFLKKSI